MTFPTFAPGDVLNASDMNAVGLWLVKTQTIGTTVSTVNVTDAFSADYDAYKITVTGGDCSTTGVNFRLQLGGTTTGYDDAAIFINTASPTSPAASGTRNGARWARIGNTRTGGGHQVCIDLLNPFLAKNTSFTGGYHNTTTVGEGIGITSGILINTTSYTDFTLSLSAGTITGGIIRVYGYRN